MQHRGRATRPLSAALLLGLLCVACQPAPPPGPPPPRQTTTSLDVETARSNLTERLVALGVTVERDLGNLRVRATDPSFMRCETLMLRPRGRDTKQTQMTRPDETITTAVIRIEGAGDRTRLSWEPRFVGSYLNRLDNLRFDHPCRSTGIFEQLLATALPS